MKAFLDCIPCALRHALDVARMMTDDESIHEQILYEVIDLTNDLNSHQSPPALARRIHRRLRELTESPDPYHKIKQHYNALAMELCRKLEPVIRQSDNPLETAIRLAIAGNIIDLGPTSSITDEDIDKTIRQSLTAPLDQSLIEQLRQDADHARDILYLADNAGEIVFDRLLIEQLPAEKVTVAVRGFPVLNDATMDDAKATGLTTRVNVIDNGSDAPGTILETCSESFVTHFTHADLIISKGQGNYESLSDADKPIYFLLKAKCRVVASDLNCELGSMVIHKNDVQQEISSRKPLFDSERR